MNSMDIIIIIIIIIIGYKAIIIFGSLVSKNTKIEI
jgi:hypothetical protein